MQVRLDDDVAAFVLERKDRDGGSMSKAANALLREQMLNGQIIGQHLADSDLVRVRKFAAEWHGELTWVEVAHWLDMTQEQAEAALAALAEANEFAERVHGYRLPASDGVVRPVVAVASGECPHPILRRVGTICGLCGQPAGELGEDHQ